MSKAPIKQTTERIITVIVVVLFVGALVWLGFIIFSGDDGLESFNLTSTSDTADVMIDELMPERPIQVTDGVKHSVPLDEIVGGGPTKDGIPSIDDPKFVTVDEADDFLKDADPGISVEVDGIKRFYPYQILVWHEIVNDTFGEQRVLITYCPLCFSGIVYDPVVSGERVEFGTSGKLWESNLVMYDRKTDTLWSQILGEGIVGDRTGEKLPVLPSDITTYGSWKKANPDGEVLSRDTGAQRFYGTDPYGDYYSSSEIFFPVTKTDERLDPKEFVFGIVVDGAAKAYPVEELKKAKELEDSFGGKALVFRFDEELDAVRVFEKINGKEERFNPFTSYWFSWIAAYPDSELYTVNER